MSHSRNPSSCSDYQDSKQIEHHQHNPADLQSILSKQLGPEYLSTRPGAGGSKLTYVEGWRIISLANEVFGYDGWSSETKTIEVDFVDQLADGRFNVGVSAIVKVTLKNGTSREDVGYGKLENSRSKADALDKCKKEAVTDALKRTLRTFGNLLGNCLYDKSYLNNIKTMQAQKEKFLPSKLYRPQHVNNRATTSAAESKPFDNQASSEEKEFAKPTLPVTVSNNLVTPKAVVAPISKPTVYKAGLQHTKPERKFDPTKLPQPKIPEKRKFQELLEKENNIHLDAKSVQAEQEETPDDSIPFPATLSDNYFDLDENELAELDNVESSEIFGVHSGQGGSGDESGLITDTSVDNQSTTLCPSSHPVHHQQQDRLLEREKMCGQAVSRPPSLKSTTISTNSAVRLNTVSSVHPPAPKFPLKTGNNLLDQSARSNTNKVIQAGHLPKIKTSVIRYPSNANGTTFNNHVQLGK